jgi:hypothetical protein
MAGEAKMESETQGPDEALARELERLDSQLVGREPPDVPLPVVDLVAGFVAGMRLVGRAQ